MANERKVLKLGDKVEVELIKVRWSFDGKPMTETAARLEFDDVKSLAEIGRRINGYKGKFTYLFVTNVTRDWCKELTINMNPRHNEWY